MSTPTPIKDSLTRMANGQMPAVVVCGRAVWFQLCRELNRPSSVHEFELDGVTFRLSKVDVK